MLFENFGAMMQSIYFTLCSDQCEWQTFKPIAMREARNADHLLVIEFITVRANMPWLSSTRIEVIVIFWDHINVMKDKAVEWIGQRCLPIPCIHNWCFVEHCWVDLKGCTTHRHINFSVDRQLFVYTCKQWHTNPSTDKDLNTSCGGGGI